MALLTKPNELSMKETYAGLIYGQPGVGKTTLALSSVNPVCIDVDRGMYRVEKRYQTPSLQVENYQQVLDLLNSNEMDGFDTIVIDTLGKLVDCMGEYVAKNNPKYRQGNGQLTQQGWGQIKIEFRALIKLINGKNKSVLFVAHESEEKEGDMTRKRPDVSGSARKDIVKELDFMGYMEMSGNKRTISFSPSSAYYAKNSMGLDSAIEIPGIQTGNDFIKAVVVSAIRNRREQDKAQAGPYDELVKTIDNIVNAAEDITAVNEAYGKLAALNHIWDSKLYAWSKVSEAAKALNGTWDKAAKRFIGPAVSKPEAPKALGQQFNALPAGGAAPEARETTKTSEELREKYQAARVELKTIMSAVDSQGNALFGDDEYFAVDKMLTGLKGSSIENHIKAITQLLEDKKLLLSNRLAATDSQAPDKPAAAPLDIPAMHAEEEPAEHIDDFEDDIPFERENVKAKPAKAELDIF
jgi:hypothetical protein